MMVHFDYYPKDLARIRALERRLESAIKRAGVGELGETEFHLDGNDGYLYMYGPDPDRLYAVVSPILKSSRLMAHAEVTKHYASRSDRCVYVSTVARATATVAGRTGAGQRKQGHNSTIKRRES